MRTTLPCGTTVSALWDVTSMLRDTRSLGQAARNYGRMSKRKCSYDAVVVRSPLRRCMIEYDLK